MSSLKRAFIYESIESSGDEEDRSHCVKRAKKAKAIEVIDLTQDEDDEEDDNAALEGSLDRFESETPYESPFTICEKSLFQRKWSKKDYIKFFDVVNSQLDPSKFESLAHKPIEEITHVWSALVAEPLREKLMALNNSGSLNQHWPEGKAIAEIHHIRTGRVLLVIQDDESEEEIKFEDLSEADLDYLKSQYNEHDWKLVAARCEVEETEGPTVD